MLLGGSKALFIRGFLELFEEALNPWDGSWSCGSHLDLPSLGYSLLLQLWPLGLADVTFLF